MTEPNSISCTQLAETYNISHDSVNRFLEREDYTPHDLYQEAIQDISHYITVFYNQVRLHSKLGYLSPNSFEEKYHNLSIALSDFTWPLQRSPLDYEKAH